MQDEDVQRGALDEPKRMKGRGSFCVEYSYQVPPRWGFVQAKSVEVGGGRAEELTELISGELKHIFSDATTPLGVFCKDLKIVPRSLAARRAKSPIRGTVSPC